jgi:hypothetical protein
VARSGKGIDRMKMVYNESILAPGAGSFMRESNGHQSLVECAPP